MNNLRDHSWAGMVQIEGLSRMIYSQEKHIEKNVSLSHGGKALQVNKWCNTFHLSGFR